MRIVTFNVQHARMPGGSVDTTLLARYCGGLGADILALQEVDVGVRRSGRANQVAEVARATGMTPVFGAAHWVGTRGRYGIVLLVRGLVGELVTLTLPRLGRREPRVAILGTVEVAGRRLSVAATHLSVNRAESVRQLHALLDALGGRPSPRLLLGDLNLRPNRVVPALEGRGWSVADTTASTYPARAPFLRIDHVAVEGLMVKKVDVLAAAPVSDHRPLVVEVA